MDNAPSHPANLSDLQTSIPVEVVSLPPNTTALILPMDQGVISNFKAYYLRRTFKQMFEKTDGKDKQSIRDFWKQYNIMNAVENIHFSGHKVTEKCLKRVWKQIWPDLWKNNDCRNSDVDLNEIVDSAKRTGVEEVNVNDIEEFLQDPGESRSDDVLKELANQEQQENKDSSDSEEEQKEISTEFLKNSLDTITDIMDEFVENDNNFYRSSKTRRSDL